MAALLQCMAALWDGALKKLKAVCDAAGISMVDGATGWLLSQPGISCVLIGASIAAAWGADHTDVAAS